jgi:nucleoside phosphorylase
LLRIVGERKKGVKNDEAKAYDKAVPPLLKDGDFRKSYLGMTESKFRIRHKTKIDIYDAVISEAVVKYTIDDTEARTRAYLLDHLDMKVTIESLKDPVDKILNDGLGTNEKAERLKHLFEDDPLLLKEATENLKTEEPHKTLLAIKSGGKEHSISNINDYVGDKLNDPLMEWVISKKIPVEVHATSVLLSFAKLKVEGFTDIIEIPSSHTGTKKYVAANPESGLAKIVFQTQPGASYAIQTVGQFLFYELYKDLGAREKLTPIEGDFVHKDFKARNLLGVEGKVARYLLVKSGSTTGFIAEIPFVDHPHEITEAGAIHLIGVGGEEVILKGVDVQTLPVDQLKVVNEEVKWDNVYVEALKDAGVEVAEIACIGRKEALKTALKAFGVTPSVNMELPYFNVTVFHLKRDLLGPVVLLAFQISPDFFGDRAGALALALKRIGVKHVTFVGTAGGLAKGLEKGDFVVPKDFANYAEEALGEKMPNEAMGLLPPEKGLKEGGLHVGVHSPITESREMIEELKRLDVSTVDCEAGFIADALRGSGVSLYALYYVSDVPGSQESIGMGGTATTPITTTSVSTVATGPELTERAVLEIVKRVVGRIEASDKKLAKQENPVNRDGTMDVTLEGKKKGKLQLTVSGPELAKGDVVGLLALLGNRLSKLIVSEGGVVTGIVLGLLNTCALEFYRDFRLKVTIGIKTK